MRCRRRENCLALQTGETLELLSSNRLAATPHFVNSTASTLGRAALETIERHKAQDESWRAVERGTVSRETLAVFLQVGAILESSLAQQMCPLIAHTVLSGLQPDNHEVVSSEGETFGAFTERVNKRHY